MDGSISRTTGSGLFSILAVSLLYFPSPRSVLFPPRMHLPSIRYMLPPSHQGGIGWVKLRGQSGKVRFRQLWCFFENAKESR